MSGGCVYTHIYMYTYVYVYIRICIYVYVYIHVNDCLSKHVWMFSFYIMHIF